MRTTHILVLSALTLLLTCSQVGCASAKKVGEEKSNFLTGTNTLVEADCLTVTNAAKAVAEEDLKLRIEKHQATMLDGQVVARSASRMKLVIRVKQAGENLSRVTVRAGGFGDRSIQKQVLDRMRAKLPQPPAPAEAPYAQVTEQGQPTGGPVMQPPSQPQSRPQGQAMTPAQQQPVQQQPTAQLPF